MSQKVILILIAFAVVVFVMKKYSTDDLTPLQRSVSTELQNYGFADVDVTTLSTDQIAEISQLLHSNKGTAQITGTIGAILGRDSAN